MVDTGHPDGIDAKSDHRRVESAAIRLASDSATMTSTSVVDRLALPQPPSRDRRRPAAASSTPRGGRGLAGRCTADRPDSALSNFSELDSGYDELRSFAVTPVIPPEIVLTGPQDVHEDLLPAEVTSSSVADEPEDDGNGGEQHRNEEEDKSVSEESDLCRSEAFPEDRCNASSIIIDPEEGLLSANTGTGNSSAVSPASLNATDGRRLSAGNNDCETTSIASLYNSCSLIQLTLQSFSAVG